MDSKIYTSVHILYARKDFGFIELMSVIVLTSLTKQMDSTIHTSVHILPVHLFVKLAFVE